MSAERLGGLNWCASTLPLPSAFSLLAGPARQGGWDRAQLGVLLERRLTVASPPFLGWEALVRDGTLERVSRALNSRPESIRLGAQLAQWWPPALRPLLRSQDPTTFDRLRFCRMCLLRGDHSPLFQLPWWTGCPVHDEPLCDGCPRCHAPIPAGLPHERPSQWLVCPRCAAELSDRALLAHLHATPGRQNDALWWSVLAAYRRWLRATETVRWALPCNAQGEGSFADVAHLAVRHLVATMPVPAELVRHLPTMTLTSANARAWSRTFAEGTTLPSVKELGFASPQAMRKAGRRFYGALPIPEACRHTLATAQRRLRRKLRISLIGHGSPRAPPDAVFYNWRGRRPPAVQAFRLLTGLAATDCVDGVAYLDFRSVELLLEPPVWMAQGLLARWTGVNLREGRVWPEDRTILLSWPDWIVRAHPSKPVLRHERQPRGALAWLYERMILEAWQDLALECFSRAKPDGVLAWASGPMLGARSLRERDVFVPIYAKIDAQAVLNDELTHPLLVHGRADRRRPRGWAVAIMQVAGDGPETYIAMLGRAAPQPFMPPSLPSFEAHWTWPEEMTSEDVKSKSQATE